MRVAFLTNMLGSGGAQKMMAFVINTIAPVAEMVLIIMTQNEIAYEFPSNVSIQVIEYEKTVEPRVLGKLKEVQLYAKRTKEILETNSIDILCTFGAYYTTVGVLATKGTSCKIIGSERRAPQMMSKLWKTISRYSYKACDMMVFQLIGARDFYDKIPDQRTMIIPNPFIPKSSDIPPSKTRRNVICMAAARLEYEKGFDIGLQAMSFVLQRHPEYKMEIYGAGNFDEMFGSLIDKLHIRNSVEYKGLSKTIISDIYDAKVFLLPSRSEGIPNMLLEAMAAGIPCVAADCPPGGPKMLLGNNENGLIVPMENPQDTADAICSVIEDSELEKKISNNATTVRNRFLPEDISKYWLECFSRVYEGRNEDNA